MSLTPTSMATRVSRLLMTPLHFMQLFTGAKSFEKNPLMGSRYLNEHGLHVARVSLAMRMASLRRRRLAHLVAPDEAARFERDGYLQIDNFLEPDTFQALLREVSDTDFERQDMHQGSTITRRSMIDESDLLKLPAMRQACEDPRLLNRVRYVASHAGQPLLTLQTVLAKANGSPDPQTDLHSDTFHPTAKAWLFLTDVGEDDGPFCYVPGSHKVTPQRFAWERKLSTELDAVENRYARRGSLRVKAEELAGLGYPEPVRMTVRANTLVIADTHGFHARCASPRDTVRIELYASLRRGPYLPFVAAPLGGLHLAALPLVKRRVNRLIIDSLGLMGRLGLRGSPWHPIGRGRASEWTHCDD